MTEGGHIRIEIGAYGLAAKKCYDKSRIRINTYRPDVGPTWYELCVYQHENHLHDTSGIEVSMSREQLEALRNQIDEVLEANE